MVVRALVNSLSKTQLTVRVRFKTSTDARLENIDQRLVKRRRCQFHVM